MLTLNLFGQYFFYLFKMKNRNLTLNTGVFILFQDDKKIISLAGIVSKILDKEAWLPELEVLSASYQSSMPSESPT